MNINPKIPEVLNDGRICDKVEDCLFGFYVFNNGSTVSDKPDVFFNINSEARYTICFSYISGYSTLTFAYLTQQPMVPGNIDGYQAFFTESLLSKEILALAVKFNLFRSEPPTRFLVNHNQEWRISEIYKSMVAECSGPYRGKSEMIRTFIHELILITRRLLPGPY